MFFLSKHPHCQVTKSWTEHFQLIGLGFNFINVLQAAFMPTDTKSAKKTVKLSSFFALLGSASVKAACRTLVKLNPCFEFSFKAFIRQQKNTLALLNNGLQIFSYSPLTWNHVVGNEGSIFFLRKYLERELQSFIPDFMQIFEEEGSQETLEKVNLFCSTNVVFLILFFR